MTDTTVDAATDSTTEPKVTPRLKTLKVEEPPARKAGEIVASVDELVAKLRLAEVLP